MPEGLIFTQSADALTIIPAMSIPSSANKTEAGEETLLWKNLALSALSAEQSFGATPKLTVAKAATALTLQKKDM